MDSVIETVSITVSLVSLFLIPVAVLGILYLIKRNGFYISVNCWFCNSWTKVLYSDRNSFCCSSCLQYNGFNEDGGYNRVIEEQFDTSSNIQNKTTIKTEAASNGLCSYCNNNQQLKIRQLANFVPLNEKNYDVEIEHFQAQLEKSYKLCKKCDKVLKKTIENQHAWLFGNRIKNLHKKGLNLLNANKQKIFIKAPIKSVFLKLVRYSLIIFSFIVLYQTLNVKMSYSKSTVKEYMPEIFMPYAVLMSEWCHKISNSTESIIRMISEKYDIHPTYGLKVGKMIKNDILHITWIGLMMEIVLLMWQPKSGLWIANEILGWVFLIATSFSTFHDDYFVYINTIQILCSLVIIYGLLIASKPKEVTQKKYKFKKLKTSTSETEYSDEEIVEESSSSSSKTSPSQKSCISNNIFNASRPKSPNNFLFQDMLQNTANLNDTFITARSTKSASVLNSSFKNDSLNSSSDELRRSLDNLHLSNLTFRPQPSTSPVFSVSSVNRPILSPPKLKNITQNSWIAGGFWKSDAASLPPTSEFTNLSRSSSQSSGFVSANAYNSLPSSREPSVCGDFEKASILSEPVYHLKPVNRLKSSFSFNSFQVPKQVNTSQFYYKSDNTFYPVLRQNNMLLISDVPRFNFENNFGNMPVKGFSGSSNHTLPLFGQKPVISSLFKNVQCATSQSHNFKTLH